MTLYNLIGRRRYSTVSTKTACQYLTASILALILDFVDKILMEINVNISNELNFSDFYRNGNYIGLLTKFT